MTFDKELRMTLKAEVLELIEQSKGTPIELETIVAKIKQKHSNVNDRRIRDRDIVMAVHDLLDFHTIAMTGDRRLRVVPMDS